MKNVSIFFTYYNYLPYLTENFYTAISQLLCKGKRFLRVRKRSERFSYVL